MGVCCGHGGHAEGVQEKKGNNAAAADTGFTAVSNNTLRFAPVAFDIVVPDGSAASAPRPNALASGTNEAGGEVQDLSGTLSNVSMHTLRDGSVAMDRSGIGYDPMNATLNSMSFTNSFHAVDKKAVRQFMQNVARLAEHNNGKGTLLEESMIGGPNAAASLVGDVTGSRSMMGGLNTNNTIVQEDLDYIAAGATLTDRVARLEEVEAVLRQTIEGSWRVDSMLLQLACCQVVPTLRQRRRPWAGAGAAGAGGAGAAQHGQHKAHQPVLVIHAQGMTMDGSTSMGSPPTALSASRTPAPAAANHGGEFSPANASDGRDTSLMLGASRSRMAEPPAGTKVQQYEMLALTCRDIDPHKTHAAMIENDTWDFLSVDGAAAALSEGRCMFRFLCNSLAELNPETQSIVDSFINLSSFADEVAENNAPKVNVHDSEDAAKYIGIHVKTMYMLPGITLKEITKDLIVSTDYQKACQPSENKVQDCEVDDTFRLTMSIIRFVFSLTIQFKVSEITDPAALQALAVCDGMVPAKAIMLERTKRHIAKVDATAKVRSLLLYYPVNDGVLVNNHTVVLNTSLPKVVSKIMNTFGSQGAAQSVQTAKFTREYLIKRFGDSRKK